MSLKKNDRVRLLSVPVDVEASATKFPETVDLFRKAVGREFKVRGLGRHGHAELWLRADGSESDSPCDHSVWVEPEYLKLATAD